MPSPQPLLDEPSERKAMKLATSILSVLPAAGVLSDLHSQVSSAVHAAAAPYALSPADLPPTLSSLPVIRAVYDEAHGGRFTVLSTSGGSASCDAVLAKDDAFAFTRDHLSAGDAGTETAVFLPGMNTPHERREGYESYTAPERLVHYSKILGGKRIAQLHTGSSIDQPPVRVSVSNSPFFGSLVKVVRRLGVLDLDGDGESGGEVGDGDVVLSAGMVDSLQTVFSAMDIESNRMQDSMAKIIAHATPESPIVFMAYSRASIEIAASLRKHIAKTESAGVPSTDIRANLRRSITVLSVGAGTSHWPDGPAYIHLGSIHDVVSNGSGVHNGRPRGAGKDAVFLTTQKKVFGGDDNHNFSALTAPYLSVILLANKTTSIRKLYELARAGDASGKIYSEQCTSGVASASSFFGGIVNLVKGFLPTPAAPVGGGDLIVPENIDELMLAMIVVCNGLAYGWANLADTDGDDTIVELPSEDDALALLKEHFDADIIDSIHNNCADIYCEDSEFAKPKTYQARDTVETA